MPRKTPNLRKMNAAVARWIEDARGFTNGAELLDRKVVMVERFIAELGRDDGPVPEQLIGLTAADLFSAQWALQDAARALRERAARLVAQKAAA